MKFQWAIMLGVCRHNAQPALAGRVTILNLSAKDEVQIRNAGFSFGEWWARLNVSQLSLTFYYILRTLGLSLAFSMPFPANR